MAYTDFKPVHKNTSRTKKKIYNWLKTKSVGKVTIKSGTKAFKIVQHVKSPKVESLFTNVELTIRIFSSTIVTNCNEERFLALRRVKMCLRSTLRQDKMKVLPHLFINSDFIKNIFFFNKIVEYFVVFKIKKKIGTSNANFSKKKKQFHKKIKVTFLYV